MHPTDPRLTHPETSADPEIDVSGLWFCPSCGDIHREPTCPTPRQWFRKNEARVEVDVRLCACCSRRAVRSGSPFASFFCSECGPRVVEVNRSMGRLVVPICRDAEANRAILPAPVDGQADARGVADPTRFLGAQLEQLEHESYQRTMFLLDRLRILDGEPIALERFLREVVQLRHESFHGPAALRLLAADFHQYLLEIPSESPALAAQVEKKAHGFARLFRAGEARRLLDKGPAAVRDVALAWVWRVIDEVQPFPTCVDADAGMVLQRRARTVNALVDAAVAHLERAHGKATRPAAPVLPPGQPGVVFPHPGAEWPAFLPQACPVSARLVVGLEYTPAQPDISLTTYVLSMDRRHRCWVLWANVADDEGCMEPEPVAWCLRGGLEPAEAASILLEASLKNDRETYGADCARPDFGMPGLLSEDLTDVLLDLVWEAG